MLNDSTIKAIRKLKDNQGQYLWQPSLTAGAPDLLLGKPVRTSAYMPAIAADAKTVGEAIYQVSPSSGRTPAVSGADQNGTIDVGTLTNSLKTETSLTKDWVNSDGTAVTKDYLGCDISVTFALQAAISSEGGTAASSLTWRPAAELLKEKLDPETIPQ